jgi:hypothetical protein
MANVDGTVKGIMLLREPVTSGIRNLAIVTATFGAYTAATDTARLVTIATAIQNQRRDNKTVTIRGAMTAESGLVGSTQVYIGGTITPGATTTFNLANAAGTDTTFATGNPDRPVAIVIAYDLS